MTNIFISYARETQKFATRLARSLEQAGADVFLDIDDIPAGMNWSQAIQHGLDGSEVMLVIISPASMASKNVAQEWQYFIDNEKVIIPIWYKPAKRHFQLQRMQYIDFYEEEYDIAFIRLLRALKRENVYLNFPVGYDEDSFPETMPESPTGLRKKPKSQSNWIYASFTIILVAIIAGLALFASGVLKPKANAPVSTRTPTLTIGERADATFVARQTQDSNDRRATQDQVAIEQALADRIATGTQSAMQTREFLATSTQQAEETQEADASATSVQVTSEAVSASQTLVTESVASSTPTTTPTFTPTATQTIVPSGFVGNPIRSNAEWVPVSQIVDDVEMVLVPVGCFTPGFYGTTAYCFENPYWIDRTEVSNAQFGVATVPSRNDGPNFPTEFVTWDEANTYCEARGGRLPSANEWEYAARGPDNLIYPWGNEFIEHLVVFNQNSGSTAPVENNADGASWVGALNMSGNVWEWIAGGTANARPNRGGSFDWFGGTGNPDNDNLLTTASRSTDGTQRWYNIGFRCVRDYQSE